MNALLSVRRGATLRLRLRFWQAGRTARINCAGSDLFFFDHSFPIAPAITWVDAAQGDAEIFFSEAATTAMVAGKSYHCAPRVRLVGGDIIPLSRDLSVQCV